MNAEPILDPAALSEAKELLGEKFPAILGYFLEDGAAYVQEVLKAFAAGDAKGMTLAAHSLKSSARQMGAIRLSALARAIELGSRDAATGKVPLATLALVVEQFKAAFEETCKTLATYQ